MRNIRSLVSLAGRGSWWVAKRRCGRGMLVAVISILTVVYAQPPAEAVNRALLVRGNDNRAFFRDALQNDVDHLQAALLAGANWGPPNSITISVNPTPTAICNNITNLLVTPSGPNDVSWFYYTGHGSRIGDGAPIDETADVNDETVSPLQSLIDDGFDNCFAGIRGFLIVVLDSCYSGGMVSGRNDLPEALANVPLIVIAACREVETALVGTSAGPAGHPHSVFSAFLISGLTLSPGPGGRAVADLPPTGNLNGKVDVEEWFDFANAVTPSQSSALGKQHNPIMFEFNGAVPRLIDVFDYTAGPAPIVHAHGPFDVSRPKGDKCSCRTLTIPSDTFEIVNASPIEVINDRVVCYINASSVTFSNISTEEVIVAFDESFGRPFPEFTFDPTRILPGSSSLVTLNGWQPGSYMFVLQGPPFEDLMNFKPVIIEAQRLSLRDQADLSIIKVDSPDPVGVGAELTYRLRIRNLGPSDATGVIVTDNLPAIVNFVSASSGCSIEGSTVTCEIGNMEEGETAVRLIRVRPTVPGGFSNTATVTANEADPRPGNNTVTTVTTVR